MTIFVKWWLLFHHLIYCDLHQLSIKPSTTIYITILAVLKQCSACLARVVLRTTKCGATPQYKAFFYLPFFPSSSHFYWIFGFSRFRGFFTLFSTAVAPACYKRRLKWSHLQAVSGPQRQTLQLMTIIQLKWSTLIAPIICKDVGSPAWLHQSTIKISETPPTCFISIFSLFGHVNGDLTLINEVITRY